MHLQYIKLFILKNFLHYVYAFLNFTSKLSHPHPPLTTHPLPRKHFSEFSNTSQALGRWGACHAAKYNQIFSS